MGLDFGKSSIGNPAQAGNGLQEKNEIEVVEKYDIVADRQQMNAELVNSKEVDRKSTRLNSSHGIGSRMPSSA